MSTELKRKLEAIGIVGRPITKDLMIDPDDPTKTPTKIQLYMMFGTANDIVHGTGTFGEWTALIGDFVAINNDGEEFRAGRCFPPRALVDLLAPKLKANAEAAILFAVAVGIKPDAKSATGYVWWVTPLTEVKENDAMAELRALTTSVKTDVKQLEGPKKK